MSHIDEQLESSRELDIRQEQDELMNRLNKLTLNESDEISINLFNILKASNTPMIKFDRT